MSDKTYAPAKSLTETAHINEAKYDEMYAASVKDPDGFWSEHARRIDWIKPFSKVKEVSYEFGNVSIKWFEDGQLTVAANCV